MTTPRKKPQRRTPGNSKTPPRARGTRRPAATRAPRAIAPPAAAPKAAAPAWDREFLDANVPAVGHDANTAEERHAALDHVVTNVWATEDITTIRRVDDASPFKWVMWRRAATPPA